MDELTKIELPGGINSFGERQPRGISITKPKGGNYYDAISFEQQDDNHHLPSIEEFHVIGKFAPFMIPLELTLFSNSLVELKGDRVKGIFFTRSGNNFESKEFDLPKSKSEFYILVRIEY